MPLILVVWINSVKNIFQFIVLFLLVFIFLQSSYTFRISQNNCLVMAVSSAPQIHVQTTVSTPRPMLVAPQVAAEIAAANASAARTPSSATGSPVTSDVSH